MTAHKNLPIEPLRRAIDMRGSLMAVVGNEVFSEADAEERGLSFADWMRRNLEYRRLDAALRRGDEAGAVTYRFAEEFCVKYLHVTPGTIFGDDWYNLTPRQELEAKWAERNECRDAIANGMTDEEIEAYYGTDVSQWVSELRSKITAA